MTESTNITPPTDAAQDEFVVALEHANLVEGVLSEAHPGWDPSSTKRSDPLGLALISLGSGEEARSALETGLPRLLGGLERTEDAESVDHAGVIRKQVVEWGAPSTHLDWVLQSLRAFFTVRYDGWVPTIGKNRFVGGAIGPGGSISHGGGPDPERVDFVPPAAGTDGSGVVVGVLDTGIVRHPWFTSGVLAPQADVLEEPVEGHFSAGHATFVTGLVLRHAPGATVRCRKVLDETGTASSWDVANAMVELGRTGVHVLNLSLVCYTQDKQPPLALATAVDRLGPSTLVVACAGNHGDPALKLSKVQQREPAWPAALDDVVAVGSSRRDPTAKGGYAVSGFTPKRAPWIDLLAEGEEVPSSYFTGTVRHLCSVCGNAGQKSFDGYASWSGTSFAAARVSGRVAAIAAGRKVPPREAYRVMVQDLKRESPDQPPFLDVDAQLPRT